MTAIECQNVTCHYGAHPALRDVSFSVACGEWVYILGPSASGKTTLLRAIAGLRPIDSGEVILDGRIATNRHIALAPHERGVGLLFQEPSLWPHLTAAANVALGIRERGLSRRARLAAAREWMDRVGLAPSAAGQYPGQLSGGQGRAVALARALAAQPRTLLLDEPTAHLDIHLAEALMARLIGLQRELGLTVLCVTHAFEPPMTIADRTLILEAGALRHDGPFFGLSAEPPSPFVEALRRRIERTPMT